MMAERSIVTYYPLFTVGVEDGRGRRKAESGMLGLDSGYLVKEKGLKMHVRSR